jgi:hypothetical protein
MYAKPDCIDSDKIWHESAKFRYVTAMQRVFGEICARIANPMVLKFLLHKINARPKK